MSTLRAGDELRLRAGQEVHYIAALDQDGEVLLTVPLDNPLVVEGGERAVVTAVDVNVKVELGGSYRRR